MSRHLKHWSMFKMDRLFPATPPNSTHPYTGSRSIEWCRSFLDRLPGRFPQHPPLDMAASLSIRPLVWLLPSASAPDSCSKLGSCLVTVSCRKAYLPIEDTLNGKRPNLVHRPRAGSAPRGVKSSRFDAVSRSYARGSISYRVPTAVQQPLSKFCCGLVSV